MQCPTCHTLMGTDEPRLNLVVYSCEECGRWQEYEDGQLIYESTPDRPMEPPVRIHGGSDNEWEDITRECELFAIDRRGVSVFGLWYGDDLIEKWETEGDNRKYDIKTSSPIKILKRKDTL